MFFMPENANQNDIVYSVTQLTSIIKDVIEGSFPEIILEA